MTNEMLEWVGQDVITGHMKTTAMSQTRAVLTLIDRAEIDRRLIDRLFSEVARLEQQVSELRTMISQQQQPAA